ncbi:hypothetical protein SISSUDRAFT_1122362 [Sistotremastrum suecicum HHB10207 ss-3]|uniref:Uncharacterized protein n=1 Tax=Sistotremastrum suecicum HHB10207 ss-3 TaxID=1314776 RepID=A0A165ZGJ4_9AGAM|nr:hypothetical protein SISSUDRAFT_1122362 [Sistotremastrum suecicum HHB10207 ss-3]
MVQEDGPGHINLLPDEMLALIMEFVVYQADLRELVNGRLPGILPDRYGTEPVVYQAPRISFVCKRWRAIALATPRLWAQLHLSWPDSAISTYFSRSSSVPLSLGINERSCIREGDNREFMEDLQPISPLQRMIQSLTASNSLHRICRLSIQWRGSLLGPDRMPPDLSAFIKSLLSQEVPAITPNLFQYHFMSTDYISRIYDSSLSLAHLPLLTDICLEWTSLRFILPSPCLLTDVYARCSQATETDVIRFLESCPLLENVVVHLSRFGFEDKEGSSNFDSKPEVIDRAPLPHLKSLEITWVDTRFAEDILAKFDIPSSASIRLSIARAELQSVITSLPSSILNVLVLAHILAIYVEHPGSADPDFELEFEASSYPRFKINFSDCRSPRNGRYHELSSSEEKRWRIAETKGLFEELTHLGPFEHLLSLSIRGRSVCGVESTIISLFFTQLPCVERISLRTIDGDPIITALSSITIPTTTLISTPSGDRTVISSTIKLPVPKLQFLNIRKAHFSRSLLERVLLDRENWAEEKFEVKTTPSKKRHWRAAARGDIDVSGKGAGRSVDRVWNQLKWEDYVEEGEDWTDTSYDYDDDSDEDNEDGRPEDEESTGNRRGSDEGYF